MWLKFVFDSDQKHKGNYGVLEKFASFCASGKYQKELFNLGECSEISGARIVPRVMHDKTVLLV